MIWQWGSPKPSLANWEHVLKAVSLWAWTLGSGLHTIQLVVAWNVRRKNKFPFILFSGNNFFDYIKQIKKKENPNPNPHPNKNKN